MTTIGVLNRTELQRALTGYDLALPRLMILQDTFWALLLMMLKAE